MRKHMIGIEIVIFMMTGTEISGKTTITIMI
jgi:hypothetical protein